MLRNLLTDIHINPAENNNEVLQWACGYGNGDAIRLLLADHRVDPTMNNNDTLRSACEHGHVNVVCILLADGRVDPASNRNDPIRQACFYGHTDVVRILLTDPRVDPSDYNNDAIRWACANGHIDVVRLLLDDRRVNPANNINQVLRLACTRDHVEMICLLLMDPRIDIFDVFKTCSDIMRKFGKYETMCALFALAGIEPFCTDWGPLDPKVHNLDMLRYWQTTSYIKLYNQDEEFRNGPYGVLLRHRLEIADLYGSAALTSRLPLEMVELVLEYTG